MGDVPRYEHHTTEVDGHVTLAEAFLYAAQHTTAPTMMVATGPIAALAPMSPSSTAAANRMVAMAMPETGLLEEPTRPAM